MFRRVAMCAVFLLVTTAGLLAVTLPNDTQQTIFYANVCDQATLSVPDEIGFDVVNIGEDTSASGILVSASNVVLTSGCALRIELKAEAESFTAPEGASSTWDADDVSWAAGSWTGGLGSSGTLENGVYHKIAESDANPTELTCNDMSFTLKARSGITVAGQYVLTGTWRFTSFTP